MEAIAKLKKCPTSPRKMRLVADSIRGKKIDEAIKLLQFSPKHAAIDLEKTLRSAIKNWETKNENEDISKCDLYVKEIFVDEGTPYKRIQPAPQGRAHKILKRSHHVTIKIGDNLVAKDKVEIEENNEVQENS